MTTPHKHAELIKAWADGAVIQYSKDEQRTWYDMPQPVWCAPGAFRIKPTVVSSLSDYDLWFAYYDSKISARVAVENARQYPACADGRIIQMIRQVADAAVQRYIKENMK